MVTPAVEVGTTTITRSGSGVVTGVVFLDLGSKQFPGPGWNDFVVVVLGWWLEATLQVLRGPSTKATLRFMDGPYRVEIERIGPVECHLRCVDEHGAGSTSAEWTGPFGAIADSLYSAAKAVDRACFESGWKSEDIDRLRELIGESRKAQKLGN
jgi:hypothetical protein